MPAPCTRCSLSCGEKGMAACSLRPRVPRCTSTACTASAAWAPAPAAFCVRRRASGLIPARTTIPRPAAAATAAAAVLERVSLLEPQNSIVPAPGIAPARRVDDAQTHDADGGGVLGMPLFVSLCDEVCRACQLNPEATRGAFKALKGLGVTGVTLSVWWGSVEPSPRRYDWSALWPVVKTARDVGLRVKASLCFHGDDQHKLPAWVIAAGVECPDIYYTDKSGGRNADCLSLGVDHAPVLAGRTGLEAYVDLMDAFRREFEQHLGTTVTDVDVGLGPKGELRYPSIDNRWAFPGIGEFQCYDAFMLSSLAACAHQVGQPHWGTSGPHDAGSYCQWPHQTGFFHHQGSWTSEYGHFFLQWYSQQLIGHADAVLGGAARAFGGAAGLRLWARLPVVGLWYNQAAHAAELTAGWYNTAARDGYLPALQVLRDHGVALQLSGGEMRDGEQPSHALSSPEHLLLQLRAAAAALQLPVLLANQGAGFDARALGELERKAFERTTHMGVDVEPVSHLQFHGMSDLMFEAQHWGCFKDWVAKVRRRAQDEAARAGGGGSGGGGGPRQQQQQQQQRRGGAGATAMRDAPVYRSSGGGGGGAALPSSVSSAALHQAHREGGLLVLPPEPDEGLQQAQPRPAHQQQRQTAVFV